MNKNRIANYLIENGKKTYSDSDVLILIMLRTEKTANIVNCIKYACHTSAYFNKRELPQSLGNGANKQIC